MSSLTLRDCVCVFPFQAVCMWLPPTAAEALEGTVQPRAAGPRVHGADADRHLSRHVCICKAAIPDSCVQLVHKHLLIRIQHLWSKIIVYLELC